MPLFLLQRVLAAGILLAAACMQRSVAVRRKNNKHCLSQLLKAVSALQYGQVVNIIIPRPPPPEVGPPSGLGKVIIEYPDSDSAAKARAAMHNRRFAGRTVTAKYLNEANYAAGNLD